MTQFRTHSFGEDDSTRLLNEKYLGILEPGVYRGYDFIPTADLDLVLSPALTGFSNKGTLESILNTKDGVIIKETGDITVPNIPPSTLPRIDLIVCQHTYQTFEGGEEATYSFIQGTEDVNPVAPNLPSDDSFNLIGRLYIPANFASLTDAGVFFEKANFPEFGGRAKIDLTEKGVANGVASLNAQGFVPISQLPPDIKSMKVVNDIAARDAYAVVEGERVYVKDASADPTVASGSATYLWDGTAYIKVAEGESLDLSTSYNDLTDIPASFPPSAHNHEISQVNGLQTALNGKENAFVKNSAHNKNFGNNPGNVPNIGGTLQANKNVVSNAQGKLVTQDLPAQTKSVFYSSNLNSTFTIQETGLYMIIAQWTIPPTSSGWLWIRINHSPMFNGFAGVSSGEWGTGKTIRAMDFLPLNPGDLITLDSFNHSGSGSRPAFWVIRLGG